MQQIWRSYPPLGIKVTESTQGVDFRERTEHTRDTVLLARESGSPIRNRLSHGSRRRQDTHSQALIPIRSAAAVSRCRSISANNTSVKVITRKRWSTGQRAPDTRRRPSEWAHLQAAGRYGRPPFRPDALIADFSSDVTHNINGESGCHSLLFPSPPSERSSRNRTSLQTGAQFSRLYAMPSTKPLHRVCGSGVVSPSFSFGIQTKRRKAFYRIAKLRRSTAS
jgi:hypothetical protein